METRILVLDNYDSFTYNIVQIVKDLGYKVDVYRNDKISLEEVGNYDKIILSPGPGVPSESGILLDVIKTYASKKSIFGICLGEQAIGEAFGAKLTNLSSVYHGISSKIKITKQDEYTFAGLPAEIEVGRYHSWVVDAEGLPECLEVTSETEDGLIMGLRHKTYDVRGVQFHPESVLTPSGKTILENFLKK